MRKRILSVIAIYTTISFVGFMFPQIAVADIDGDKAGDYELFLQEEADVSTGILEDDIERQLNLQGVFDSDIRDMDEDTIEELSNGEEFKVEVQYFEETDDDMEIVSEEEVEEYFEEVYNEGQSKKLHRGESINISKKNKRTKTILQRIGLEEEVFALTKPETSASGMLRTVLVVYQSAIDKKTIHTCALAEWLSEPKYRLNDYLCISSYGKDTVFNKNMEYVATYQYDLYCIGGSVKPQIYTRQDSKDIMFCPNGFYTYVNLCDDAPGYYVKNNKIFLKGYFSVNDYNRDGDIFVYVRYAHQQKKLKSNVSVNVSINSAGTISFGLSSGANIATYYNIISKVPSLTFPYKVNPVYK